MQRTHSTQGSAEFSLMFRMCVNTQHSPVAWLLLHASSSLLGAQSVLTGRALRKVIDLGVMSTNFVSGQLKQSLPPGLPQTFLTVLPCMTVCCPPMAAQRQCVPTPDLPPVPIIPGSLAGQASPGQARPSLNCLLAIAPCTLPPPPAASLLLLCTPVPLRLHAEQS